MIQIMTDCGAYECELWEIDEIVTDPRKADEPDPLDFSEYF